jgi:heat shock protein HslJ
VFRVTRITDRGADVAIAREPKIAFTIGHLVAEMGCNTIQGAYTVDGEHRLVKPLGMVSQVGCGLLDQENRIIRALRTGAALALRGDRLTISNNDVTLDTTSAP